MNAKIMIAIIATFAMLFAGVAVADSSDAETPMSENTVEFYVDGVTYTTKLVKEGENNMVLPDLEGIGATLKPGKEFKGWFASEGTEYTNEPLSAAGSIIKDEPDLRYVAYIDDMIFTVTFTADGKTVTTVSGTIADSITAPTAPSKTGFTFKGWSSDDGATLITDFTDVKFTANITYDAIYVEDYALTFEVDGTAYPGGTVADPIIPQPPVKEGFTFKGWSTDGKNVIEDIESAIASVNEATKFVAIFEPAVYTVSFEVDGQIVATQTVKHGELATEPAFIPALEGMDFIEWDFDFTQAITGDTTIVAVFEPTPEPEPTGLANPTVQIMVIIIGVLVVFIVALLIWKKDEVKVIIIKKLDKTKNQEEPKQ